MLKSYSLKKKLINLCLKIAEDKLNKHPSFKSYPHYSFIIQNNKLIGHGVNRAVEPPRHWGYHTHKDVNYLPKLHSELDAWQRVKGILDDRDFEIVNIRLNRRSELMLSAPCKNCYSLLTELGCRTFWYSTNINFVKLSLNEFCLKETYE